MAGPARRQGRARAARPDCGFGCTPGGTRRAVVRQRLQPRAVASGLALFRARREPAADTSTPARCSSNRPEANRGGRVSSLAGVLLHHVLHDVFALYASVVMAHFGLQVFFAHRSYRRALATRGARSSRLPDVDVVITSYNEDPASLRACLDSLLAQDYRGAVRVYVVDDCSKNRTQLMPVYAEFDLMPGWSVLLPERNRGKRMAQDAAFRHCQGELLVTVDSDTIVDPDAVAEIVRAFDDERVGAVTGDVVVNNCRTNLPRRSPYMVFEVVVQTALPLLLTLAVTTALLYAAVEAPARLLQYAVVIAGMAVLRCAYAIYRTRRLSFLLFVFYGFLHLGLLVPLRIRALLTLTDNSWGTRKTVSAGGRA